MNADLYTKSILTIIAGCLLYFVVTDLSSVPVASAGSGPLDVNISQVFGRRGSYSSPLPVKIVQ